jgi:hypothetical protein
MVIFSIESCLKADCYARFGKFDPKYSLSFLKENSLCLVCGCGFLELITSCFSYPGINHSVRVVCHVVSRGSLAGKGFAGIPRPKQGIHHRPAESSADVLAAKSDTVIIHLRIGWLVGCKVYLI